MKGPRLSVRGILSDGERLLVNRDQGQLALFGGGLEKGETARRALARELDEELGLSLPIGPLAYLIENFYVDERERRIHEIGFYFQVSVPPETAIAAREEKLDPVWLPLDQVAAAPLLPAVLREQLALGLPRQTVELVQIDRAAFPEVL